MKPSPMWCISTTRF